tara:strand:- start:134 stop:280 length:147 start_codon:yes stop_codon:yes gene_type:complete
LEDLDLAAYALLTDNPHMVGLIQSDRFVHCRIVKLKQGMGGKEWWLYE